MYIEVLVEIKNKQLDKTFTYRVDNALQKEIEVGKRVLVPFGKQELEGYILNVKDESDVDAKDIIAVIDEEPVLNKEMLELGKFLQKSTLCSLSTSYATMLPKALKAKKGVTIKKKMQTHLKLNMDYESAFDLVTSSVQKDVLKLFASDHVILKKQANLVSSSATKTLIQNGILEELESELYRYELKQYRKEDKKELTEEQKNAYQKIKSSFFEEKIFLLHGVTGSGKTEVYLQLIHDVLENKKTVLVLVPEISITTQLVERFQRRFPNQIAVLHSGLSDGERFDEWRKILRKEVSIVIGARSAIFAPLYNIGLIILDEEHSETYKQENTPRYHALDIAKERARTHSCPIVLGSATPSLQTMARAMKKVYEYIPMMKRANGAKLPNIEIVDMQEEVKHRHNILSRELEYKIQEKLNKKEQVMLLLNRRGNSTTITCSNCGFTYRCPHCDISLTYHKSSSQLRCHYCGYTVFQADKCPKCFEESLNYYGLGTEKLEEYISEVFPTAKVLRMDKDTTANKGKYEEITEDFYHHKYDILLGTQMISKGLDFPDVSLVGILNADTSLNIPDYRSNERTFSLLSQACGRAGRSHTTGEVIIQTFYPENYILKCVKENDYQSFYQYEMNIRKTLRYPPYYYLVALTIKSKDYKIAQEEATKTKKYLESHLDKSSFVLGPSTANMFLVNRVYHFEILIKYRFDEHLIPTLKELDKMFLMNLKASLDIEFIS